MTRNPFFKMVPYFTHTGPKKKVCVFDFVFVLSAPLFQLRAHAVTAETSDRELGSRNEHLKVASRQEGKPPEKP